MPRVQRLILAAVFGGLFLCAWITTQSLLDLVRAQKTLETAFRTVMGTDALTRQVLLAENGLRGYLITRSAEHLAVYHMAVSDVRALRHQLDQTATDAQVRSELAELLQHVDEKMQKLAQKMALSSAGEHEQATELIRNGEGLALMEKLRTSAQHFYAQQDTRIGKLQQAHDQAIRHTFITMAAATLSSLFLLAFVVARSVAFARRMAANEADLTARNTELQTLAERTSEHNAHMQRLSELGHFLQTCEDMAEAQTLLQERLPVLLHAASGALYLMAASRNQLRRCVAWGERPFTEYFEPQECWALRKGQAFAQPNHGQASTCRHLQQPDEPSLQGTLCFPVASHGDLTGLLVLDPRGASLCLPDTLLAQMRQTALEQVSLSLGNLRLRESLRQQSIRDALTGLYNRRFLDESLSREVLRAERRSPEQPDAPLAVLMIDVDHFKQFNDKFGHELGDRVLRSVAQTLTDTVRTSDLVARYGGEEFTVVLPNTTPQVALERAQALCDAVMKMPPVADGGNVHPPITISVGMACMPEDGQEADTLVQNADAALYRAKRDGRNRVVRYTPGG